MGVFTAFIGREDVQALMPASFTGETGLAPGVFTLRRGIIPDAAAGTDYTTALGTAPFGGTVTAVRFIPDASVSGATGTATTLTLTNKTATLNAAALAFITGVDLVVGVPKVITLSGTAANLVVVAADVFQLVKTHASTGTALLGGVIEVDITRNDIL